MNELERVGRQGFIYGQINVGLRSRAPFRSRPIPSMKFVNRTDQDRATTSTPFTNSLSPFCDIFQNVVRTSWVCLHMNRAEPCNGRLAADWRHLASAHVIYLVSLEVRIHSINQSIYLTLRDSMNNDQSKRRQKTSVDSKADEVCTNKCPNRKICTTKMTI